MKRILFIFAVLFFISNGLSAQCVQDCQGYSVSPITYSAFPSTGISVSSSFLPNTDDGYTGQIPLGFGFDFYCTTYSTVLICSNGFLVFGSTPSINGADPAQTLPSATSPNNMIAFNMNDFDVSVGGNITYTTIGTTPNQMFIVTYTNVPIWNANSVINSGQIILYEGSNMIEVHTATVGLSPNPGTQGIENSTGTMGIPSPSINNVSWSGSNLAYRWEKTLIGAQPTGVSGPTLVCFGDPTLLYTCNTMTGATSYSWSMPGGWGGTSTTSALTATSGITGNLSVTASYTGCGVSPPTTLAITVNPQPLINVTSVSPPVICSGSVATINVSGATSYTLEPGSIIGTSPFTITTAANTIYSITGTGSNGCPSTTPVIIPITVNQSPTVTVNSGSICVGSSFTMSPTGANSYSYSSLFSVVTPTVVGTYSFLVIGSFPNTCVGYAVSNLSVHPVPFVTAAANRTAMCVNESVSLTASGAPNYTWTHNNSTSTVVSVSPPVSGVFTVTGANSFGCTNQATITIVVNPCTGIDETAPSGFSLFTAFPNPSVHQVNLVFDSDAAFSVMDINGKEVMYKEVAAGHHTWDVSALPPGIYLLTATNSRHVQRLKLVKE